MSVEWTYELWRDLQVALRGLRGSRSYAIAATLTLTLAIGANTAVFSVADAVLLRPMPYPDAQQIVILGRHSEQLGTRRGYLSQAEYIDVQRDVPELERAGLFDDAEQTASGDCLRDVCAPDRVRVTELTPSALRVLGTSPALGRPFTEEEGQPGHDAVVVLSDGYWMSRFGGDRSVLGRLTVLDGVPRTVIGVMPPGFKFERAQLFVPLQLNPSRAEEDRGDHSYIGIARLRRGANVGALDARLALVTARLLRDHPVYYPAASHTSFVAEPLRSYVMGQAGPSLVIMLVAVGFVLLIACANVANLNLVRADARQREIIVRLALGAGRARLVRQIIVDTAIVATGGAVLGAALAAWVVQPLLSINPGAVPNAESVTLEAPVFLFTLGVTIFGMLVAGLLPALQATRPDLQATLRDDTRGTSASRSRQRTRRILIGAEIALATFVLVLGTLLARSYMRSRQVNLGLNPAHVIAMELTLPAATYPSSAARGRLFDDLVRSVTDVGGISNASLAYVVPTHANSDWTITVEGHPVASGQDPPSPVPQVVTGGYFATLGIPLRSGRLLSASDDGRGGVNAVVNEAMARMVWPGENALGKRFHPGTDSVKSDGWFTVVGIVGDSRIDDPRVLPRPMWMATSDALTRLSEMPRTMWILARTSADPESVVPAARRALQALDPSLTFGEVRPVTGLIDDALAGSRFTVMLLAAFAAIASALAVIGVYGVVSYTVGLRTRELGVRLALGASGERIEWFVVAQGLATAIPGALSGAVIAAFGAHLVQALLFETTPHDVGVYAFTVALLVIAAAVASWIPARRAARIDPATALRAT